MQKDDEYKNFGWLDLVRAVWYLVGDQKLPYFLLTITLIGIQFYELLPAFIIGRIVDFFTNYKSGDSLNLFYLYITILSAAAAIFALVRLSIKRELGNIQSRTTYTARIKGFERLLNFSLKWHDQENTGNKVQKIQSGTTALRDLQHTLSDDIYYQFMVMLGSLISFIFISPKLFTMSLVYLGIFIFVQVKFYQVMSKLNDEYNKLIESASGTYYEGLNNVLTLKTLGVNKNFQKNVTSKEALSRDHAIYMRKIGNNKWKVFQVINALFLGLALFIIGQNYIQNTITLGSIFVLYNYFSKLQGGIGFSTFVFEQLISYKSLFARMMPIYWDQEEGEKASKSFPKNWDKISLVNASFQYKNNDQEDSGVKDLNVVIARNQKIGIVGRSGSGKSTFSKLLLGLYPLDSGKIMINSTDLADINRDDLTSHIALVLQDSEMFNLSLKENITLMRDYDQELFSQAIRIAELEDIIKKLPNGIETIIGEKGYRLSGGERQRIGIARAIYKDPEILVLDEATSSLDTKTESLIQVAMEKYLKEKTLIIVAHRVTTLKNVDRLYVFEQGKIIEEGRYTSLSKNKNSKFYKLSHKSKN